MVDDYKTEKMLLASALYGVWGSFLVDNFDSSFEGVKYSTGFTVEISYNNGEELKKLVIDFQKNPAEFFQSME